jgi:hypothetical protein
MSGGQFSPGQSPRNEHLARPTNGSSPAGDSYGLVDTLIYALDFPRYSRHSGSMKVSFAAGVWRRVQSTAGASGSSLLLLPRAGNCSGRCRVKVPFGSDWNYPDMPPPRPATQWSRQMIVFRSNSVASEPITAFASFSESAGGHFLQTRWAP